MNAVSREDRTLRVAALRAAYREELAEGTDAFFAPRARACPWCGSNRLTGRLHTADLLQHKPGAFELDRCDACGHVFQNPRLNERGLAFYYRDFYDGLGEEKLGGVFDGRAAAYRSRAESVRPHLGGAAEWLDVGTGHGHFCETARAVLPAVAFDGIDRTDGADLAERAGRVRRGHRGSLPELAARQPGSYDVVSMFHCLEHCTSPQRELEAAHAVLRPGGLLVIDVPDPESRFARLLGRWWLPWLQPQHLHLVPAGNLRRRLAECGFTVLAEEHAEAHDPVDLLAAVWSALNAVAPREDLPWLDAPPGAGRRALRTAVMIAGVPLLLAAAVLDRVVVRPFAGPLRLANAYRLVARRDADGGPPTPG
ncbi:bifunctional 3-demethylubiquinone-9 3-methyltransferase/ 2-octaprenyl-6-hydroxy phenol methylase [Streptomyces sp. ADI96-02]|uniref:class I SAM-dependent methyltransferase n=1 Tax=unclassified Streptomyces TaxID=2593676 RepID=UPI000F937C02|nr:class I SAM-dependent methyltransferase [Streptomyces sp. ADI96-02]RPK56877.1 bifunctional 3-demethylubiquinone-9 3-methyltransferase/ 2-octaprenyl-6-hydroxy phenol methylase [Streptomyces sp. ADI96-02]